MTRFRGVWWADDLDRSERDLERTESVGGLPGSEDVLVEPVGCVADRDGEVEGEGHPEETGRVWSDCCCGDRSHEQAKDDEGERAEGIKHRNASPLD